MTQTVDGEAREIIVRERQDALILPDHASAKTQLARVRDFQNVVRELFQQGHDYGVIPGTGSKATLLKPGAEKLIKLLGLADTYDFLDRVEDWDREFFNYTVRCRLVSLTTGQIVAEGLGNCNSRESKYRWRWAWPRDLSESEKAGLKTRTVRNGGTQYRVENDDIASSINTIIKMAKKRSQVDAALSAGRLSEVFTQDLEDMAGDDAPETAPPPEKSQNRPPTKVEKQEARAAVMADDDETARDAKAMAGKPPDAIPRDSDLWKSYVVQRDEARTRLPDPLLETLPIWMEPKTAAEVLEAKQTLITALDAAKAVGVEA